MTLIELAKKQEDSGAALREWAEWTTEESEMIAWLQEAGFMFRDPKPKPPCSCCGQEVR